MPNRILTPCRVPTCPNLSDCKEHPRRTHQFAPRTKIQQHYDTYGWKQFRRWRLSHNPICQDCQADGRTEVAREVHHIRKKADGGEDTKANTLALCKGCHSARTAKGE